MEPPKLIKISKNQVASNHSPPGEAYQENNLIELSFLFENVSIVKLLSTVFFIC